MLDPKQRHEVAVASGLSENALSGIDQDHCEVGRRSARHHVAGVLLVAGGICHDELAVLGREETKGDIDGDALLALGGEAINE